MSESFLYHWHINQRHERALRHMIDKVFFFLSALLENNPTQTIKSVAYWQNLHDLKEHL